jgi:membrane-bound serine protease (ClpP class)
MGLMPEGLGLVVAMLAVGYLLLLAELFLPGGVVGIFGLVAVLYGCYLAFGLGALWGSASVILSVVLTGLGVNFFFRSRAGKRLVLNDPGPRTWKAQEDGLAELAGSTGMALSDLRPAGIAEIGGRRVDVVADSEFLSQGTAVRVVEVEGNRVVVEAVEIAEAGEPEPETDT